MSVHRVNKLWLSTFKITIRFILTYYLLPHLYIRLRERDVCSSHSVTRVVSHTRNPQGALCSAPEGFRSSIKHRRRIMSSRRRRRNHPWCCSCHSAQMRIQQCGPPVDSDKTNITRLGNDTLGRKRKQRLRGRTETKATVCDTAGKTDSPDGAVCPGRREWERSRFPVRPGRICGQARRGSSGCQPQLLYTQFTPTRAECCVEIMTYQPAFQNPLIKSSYAYKQQYVKHNIVIEVFHEYTRKTRQFCVHITNQTTQQRINFCSCVAFHVFNNDVCSVRIRAQRVTVKCIPSQRAWRLIYKSIVWVFKCRNWPKMLLNCLSVLNNVKTPMNPCSWTTLT